MKNYVKEYLDKFTSRIIKESGNQDDEYNLGKMIFHGLKEEPDFLLQIDAATNETETSGSVLERSIRCALSLKKHGLKTGDVMILMGPNNIHQCIPFYAALYQGLIVYGVDQFLLKNELKSTFDSVKPKIIFCIQEKAKEVKEALGMISLDAYIVTYDNGDNFIEFEKFISQNIDKTEILNYRPLDLTSDTTALLMATSGSTGLPKCTTCTHKQFRIGCHYWYPGMTQFPKPTKVHLLVSPIQWLTALQVYVMSPIMRYTRLQTSAATTRDHIYYMINTYKPTCTVMSPTLMTTLVNPVERHKCDFSSFEFINLGGSAVSNSLLLDIREFIPSARTLALYGFSEIAGLLANPVSEPFGSIGTVVETISLKLVDPTTGKEITEANKPGEVWVKGPSLFKGYYNNDEMTKASFTEDGWFKSGDILYKDAHGYLFFVERLKLLLKYKNNQVSPGEIEEVIRTHPGVLDVAVAGIPHEEDGDLPVAFVVKKAGSNVTSGDIQNIVKESLSDSKQLRGGVVFIDHIPLTSGGKVDKQKIRRMAEALNPF